MYIRGRQGFPLVYIYKVFIEVYIVEKAHFLKKIKKKL